MNARGSLALLVVVSVLALTSAGITAQTKPTLGDYYKELPSIPLDAGYLPRTLGTWWFVDLNGDGNQDLVVIGGAIFDAVLRVWPASRIRVADRGLREGVLMRLMANA